MRATSLSLSVAFAHVLSRGQTIAHPQDRYSDALLVSRCCGFADPIAYGIDDPGTEGEIAIGA
jgi:hypothetical protein